LSVPSIPSAYTITMAPQPLQVGATVNAGMDDIRIREIAPITLSTTSTVSTRSTMDTTSRVEMGDIRIRIVEIPRVRVHMPMHYDFGISLLGMELLSFSLCGESMVITEPYRPNECELCLPAQRELREGAADPSDPAAVFTELHG
jgi:hypothetical protein